MNANERLEKINKMIYGSKEKRKADDINKD